MSQFAAHNFVIGESQMNRGLRQIFHRNAPHFEMAANQITTTMAQIATFKHNHCPSNIEKIGIYKLG